MEDWLWGIIPWGYQVLLSLQTMRSGLLDVIFAIITDIGDEIGALVILSVIYWCVNKPVGRGLAYAYLSTATLNAWVKDIWSIPRPDDPALGDTLNQAGISRRLSPARHETSPSFLSGHAQGAVVSWGYLAYALRKAWFWVVAVALIILIGFSRMYLGVHFPQDVAGGLVVGTVFLILWLLAEPRVQIRLTRLSAAGRYTLAALLLLVVLAIHPSEATATAMGAMVGLGLGFVLDSQTLRFSTSGTWSKRILRALLGLVVIFIPYFGLSVVFGLFDESMGPAMEIVWRVVRYAVIGFVGGWVAPWIFVQTKLAQSGSEGTG